ncbi:MAG: L,D-transpeptidase family protein [Chloroflexi bacterium]|nr:L,D-transpeptidase family protein [Chloroflexota bacterium]
MGRLPVSSLSISLVLALAMAAALAACAPAPLPRVHIVQPAAGGLVPLEPQIALQAVGSTIESVHLDRLDDPQAPAPSVIPAPDGWRLTAPLAPDAQYRLLVQARVTSTGFRLPWDPEPPAVIEQEQRFATVRTPRLADAPPELTARRDTPLVLRFTEPLQQVTPRAPFPATAEIDSGDPRQVKVQFAELTPGETFSLALTGIVGREGAVPGPDVELAVRTPEPAELVAISGVPVAGASATVPMEVPLTLEWSQPLRRLSYRLGDEERQWRGEPTATIPLGTSLEQGQQRTLVVLDAETAEGGWLRQPATLALSAPAPLQLAAYWPADGAVNVTPNADPTFRFSEPIADRAAAEEAIRFEPSVPGRFEWLADNRVRFVPEEPFPRETPIQVEVKAGPAGARGASGSYLIEPVTFTFQTGKLKVIDVSLREQRLTLLEDGVPVWSAPVATGVRGAETPPGRYEVLYKMPMARFRGVNPDGSRYDIPDVRWVLAFYGDYTIHGAYWRSTFGRPGSNGCISLTDANAKHVYDWADVGTPVVVRP